MTALVDLKITLFADGANIKEMVEVCGSVDGFTTNPTLMRKAGVTDYEIFAQEVINSIPEGMPVSFEVLSDDMIEMERQARVINSWGPNVYIKIPVTLTNGTSTAPLIKKLSESGLKINVTAVLTVNQVAEVFAALYSSPAPAIISVFAGRIADTGVNPVPIMKDALKIIRIKPNIKLLWASTREVLNIVQANDAGCHIITVTPDILKKLESLGRDLSMFSLETVQMFYNDAKAAGYKI
jgi:transaldolase